MADTKVYRVAAKHDGRGPFNCSSIDGYDRWDLMKAGKNNHPAPWADGLGFDNEGYQFGCRTPRQLSQWFDMAWRKKHAGWFQVEVLTLDSEHVREGGHQVCYAPNEVKSTVAYPVTVPLNRSEATWQR